MSKPSIERDGYITTPLAFFPSYLLKAHQPYSLSETYHFYVDEWVSDGMSKVSNSAAFKVITHF